MTLFSPLQNQRGVTLMVVLVMMVILGLSAGIAGSTWSSVMQKEREEQLLWVGDQYRRAIESYVNFRNQPGSPGAVGGVGTKLSPIPLYPNSLEDLLRDSRATQVVRHLRRLYKDPFTGEDFEPVRPSSVAGAGGAVGGTISASSGLTVTPVAGGISGVKSTSAEKPMKKDNFPKVYDTFKNAKKYSDWEFVYTPARAATSPRSGTQMPGSVPNPGSTPTPSPIPPPFGG